MEIQGLSSFSLPPVVASGEKQMETTGGVRRERGVDEESGQQGKGWDTPQATKEDAPRDQRGTSLGVRKGTKAQLSF